MKLTDVELKFYYTDKEEDDTLIEGRIGSNGWQQWGQPKDKLSKNVELLERITEVVGEYLEQN